MKITFCPNNYEPSGVVSFIPWNNPALHEAMRKAFNESPRETLDELIVEKDGIKAVFLPRNRA